MHHLGRGPLRYGARCALGVLALAAGCSSPPTIRFDVRAPDETAFNPLAGSVTDYALRSTDGTLIASTSATSDRLPLGPLPTVAEPEDLQLQILAGSELVGMGRFRDVRIEKGKSRSYTTDVRKPLFFAGSALPTEPGGKLDAKAGAIFDPTQSFDDLAHPTSGDPIAALPPSTSSTAVSWDGRYVFAGRTNKIALFNTGSGAIDGEVTIDFAPSRLVVAPRDVALAALQVTGASSGAVALYSDLRGVIENSATAQPVKIDIPDGAPRAAAFSADGQTLYVLLGSPNELDPCGPAKVVPPSRVASFDLEGKPGTAWTLESFGADIAIDPTGRHTSVLVSLSQKGTVVELDPTSPADAPATDELLRTTCPGAMRIVNDDLFVVSSARENSDPASDFFLLERLQLSGQKNHTSISFSAPTYDVPLGETTADGKVGFEQLFAANAIFGYELVVSPDGSRAMFATRARYQHSNELLRLFANVDCFVTIDVAEYGIYLMDTRSGAAFYMTRSQLIAGDPTNCITSCEITDGPFGPEPLFDLECNTPDGVNDRAAGLSALFGG